MDSQAKSMGFFGFSPTGAALQVMVKAGMSRKKKTPHGKSAHRTASRGEKRNEKRLPSIHSGDGTLWLFGTHAVVAALENDQRKTKRLLITKDAAKGLEESGKAGLLHGKTLPDAELVTRRDLDELLGEGAVHQGIALQVLPLPDLSIEELRDRTAESERALVVVLDQPSDPHNVGAVIRSAAGFGADAVLMPDRNAPPETAVMAKSACGALERMPIVRVGNMARSLDILREAGYWITGLDGQGEKTVAEADFSGKTVLVFGAEGPGLRRLTRESCDFLVRIPISSAIESLNLSNAVAVTLYEAVRGTD